MTESLGDGASARAPESSRLSVASLASAVVALAVFWTAAIAAANGIEQAQNLGYLIAAATGIVLGVVAVVTGVVARRRARRGAGSGAGAALAGVVLGILAITLPALLLGFFAYLEYASYQDFKNCVKGAGSGYPSYMCLKQCPTFLDSLCRSQIRW